MAKRLTKPKSISSDPWRNKKWNELVRGRQFRPSYVPALTLLVQWCQIVDQSIEDMDAGGGAQVACRNGIGDPQHIGHGRRMDQGRRRRPVAGGTRVWCEGLGGRTVLGA